MLTPYESKYLLNATYASVNQIISLLGFKPFQIKYELCEIILCRVSDRIKSVGHRIDRDRFHLEQQQAFYY